MTYASQELLQVTAALRYPWQCHNFQWTCPSVWQLLLQTACLSSRSISIAHSQVVTAIVPHRTGLLMFIRVCCCYIFCVGHLRVIKSTPRWIWHFMTSCSTSQRSIRWRHARLLQPPRLQHCLTVKPFQNKTSQLDFENVSYLLCAVVVHLGDSRSANHYMTLCQTAASQQWYQCDDAHIKQISTDSVLQASTSVYLCMYQRDSVAAAAASPISARLRRCVSKKRRSSTWLADTPLPNKTAGIAAPLRRTKRTQKNKNMRHSPLVDEDDTVENVLDVTPTQLLPTPVPAEVRSTTTPTGPTLGLCKLDRGLI